MITIDLRQMSSPRLCKHESQRSPAMQSRLMPGRGRVGVRICLVCGLAGCRFSRSAAPFRGRGRTGAGMGGAMRRKSSRAKLPNACEAIMHTTTSARNSKPSSEGLTPRSPSRQACAPLRTFSGRNAMDEFITYYAAVNEFSGREKPFAVVRRVKEETRQLQAELAQSWNAGSADHHRRRSGDVSLRGAAPVAHRGTAGGCPDSLTVVVHVVQTPAPRRETGGALM